MMMLTPKTIAQLLVAAGILMFVAGALWCVNTATFASHASKAQGIIIGNERSKTYGRGEAYYPIYEFVDDADIIHNAKTPYASSTFAFKQGDHVTVLYEHEDPTHSTIDSFKTLWLGPMLVMGFGLLFGSFALMMLCIVTRNIDHNEDAQRA
jgi:Protein of unknown function (DUF3592)